MITQKEFEQYDELYSRLRARAYECLFEHFRNVDKGEYFSGWIFVGFYHGSSAEPKLTFRYSNDDCHYLLLPIENLWSKKN